MSELKNFQYDASKDLSDLDKAVADIEKCEKDFGLRTQKLYRNLRNAAIIGIAAAIISVPSWIVISSNLNPAQNPTYQSATVSLEQSINDNSYSSSASSVSAPVYNAPSTEASSIYYNEEPPAEVPVQQQSDAESTVSLYTNQFESIKTVLETDRIKADLMMDDLKTALARVQGSAAQQILSQATEYEKNILHPRLEKSYQTMYDETMRAFENSSSDDLAAVLNDSKSLVNELNRSNSPLFAKAEQLMQDIQNKYELIENEKIEQANLAIENSMNIEEENSLASHFESDYAKALQLYDENKMDLSAMLLEESIAEMQSWNASGKDDWIARAKMLYNDYVFNYIGDVETSVSKDFSYIQNMEQGAVFAAIPMLDSEIKDICYYEYPTIKALKAKMEEYLSNTLVPQLESLCNEKYNEYAGLLPTIKLEEMDNEKMRMEAFLTGCESTMPYTSGYIEKVRLLSAQYEQQYQEQKNAFNGFLEELQYIANYSANGQYEEAMRLYNELIPQLQNQNLFNPMELLYRCYLGIDECQKAINVQP